MSRYYADQLQLQQQEADHLNKALKKDVEQFRQANQVGGRSRQSMRRSLPIC